MVYRAEFKHWRTLASDVKYGARVLAAAPDFTAIALSVIALGIGATVSIFSVVNAVLLRSLPYGYPEQLVYLWSPNVNFKGVPLELGPNVPDFYDWQRLSRSFTTLALLRPAAVNVVRGGSATRIGAAFVTGGFFRTLDVAPEVGRMLDASDDRPGRELVAVIGEALWHSDFGARRDAIGKKLQVNRRSYTIVGVMPRDFGYPFEGDIPYDGSGFKQTQIWLPAPYGVNQKTNRTNFDSAVAIGRLRRGISPAAAQDELAGIEARLQPLYPQMWRGWTALVTPLVETIVGPVEKMLWLLLGAVSLVLLIAISNVATLLLARGAARAREMGIRSALGAARSRIVRQLLTESLLLSGLGGALGVALAYAAVHLLIRLNPGNIPRFDKASVDGRVLLLAVTITFAAAILSGLLPAIYASRNGIGELLKSAGSRAVGASNRGRFALIVLEVALAVVLLTGSVLLIRSYLALAAVDPGFSPSTLTFRLHLDERYNTPALRAAFYKRFLEELRNMPGVTDAGASNSTPLNNQESLTFAQIRGFGKSREMVENRSITPDYLEAMGTQLLRGREFGPGDAGSRSPVALVNEKFAEIYFHGRDPLGGQLRIGMGDLSNARWSTIIGVIGNIRHTALDETSRPQLLQPADSGDNFAIKCAVPVQRVIPEARAALRSLDPTLTLESIRTMGERMKESNARRDFQTILLSAFAAMAIALALAGLYGLISYSVKQRTMEIGIRMAVGCTPGGVLRQVVAQGLRLTALGLLIGLGGAFALTRLIGAWLYGVQATDPVTFLAVPLFVLGVAFLACVVPAWGAARIDPVEALRRE